MNRSHLTVLTALVTLGWFLALFIDTRFRWTQAQSSSGYALQFYGNGINDIDRVKVRIDPHTPADVGGDFTIEFWMKTTATDGTCSPGASGDGWITGRTIIDRDVYGDGDVGDYGIALASGRICFGVARGSSGRTIYGSTNVANGQWHHIAVTRRASDGQMRIFVDGQPDASGLGPTGDIGYRNGRSTAYPTSDPYLVFGAEKHDAGPAYPSYSGLLDDIRISNVVRYTDAFTRPGAPHVVDGSTVALYRFDEGSGATIIDAAGGSPGERRVGGSPSGPVYVTDTPFGGTPPATPTPTRTATPTSSASGPSATATSIPASATATSSPGSNPPSPTPTRTVLPTATTGSRPIHKPVRLFLPLVTRP
ncbi:MAG: LamG domain-containing protein [Roseiflexus sp.]